MKINRNIVWAEIFFQELVNHGVKHVCIAPGSRSTPLAFAIANNNNLKPYIFIDERSCAFFALGLAKKSQSPVILICTSGTAVAEFYPAIIEAFQQKIPLIVCTADRPPELINNGANQTINQKDIYKNHILWSFDAGLPEISNERIKHIKSLAKRAFFESYINDNGPVSLNFPFRKPFEPESYTDDIDEKSNLLYHTKDMITYDLLNFSENNIADLSGIKTQLHEYKKGIIIVGPDSYKHDYSEACITLAKRLNYPILADGASCIRYGNSNCSNILVNYDAFLRVDCFISNNQPDIILQFGQTVTSKGLENYLESTRAKRYIINKTGQWYDPYNNAETVIKISPAAFCSSLLKSLDNDIRPDNEWLGKFLTAEKAAETIKEDLIYNAEFPFEGRIINEVISAIPDNSSLMVSNSMPVRDLDYFASQSARRIKIYSNRGASGIDGIISTALGIAAESDRPAFLITGDLAFYHDLNGLLAANKYSIPLIIILINNNGGGIFEMLPVSKYKNVLTDYFITPHNLDFSNFVKGYNGNYKIIETWENLSSEIQSALKSTTFSVLQINTDSKQSTKLRKLYWNKVDQKLNSVL